MSSSNYMPLFLELVTLVFSNLISFINVGCIFYLPGLSKRIPLREEDQVLRLCCFVPHSQERGIASDEKNAAHKG